MGEEVLIDFLDTGMKIIQRNDHFNFSIDTVLLSGFARINLKTKKVLELGSGNGALLMLLSKKCKAELYGIEILKTSHELALKNIKLNNLENRIKLVNDDIKNYKKLFPQQTFDLILANPPFFEYKEENSLLKKEMNMSLARHELNSEIDDFLEAAYYLLNIRGIFIIVHRSERLVEILSKMSQKRIEPKRVMFCYTKHNSVSKIVLIEGIKDGSKGLEVLEPLYIHNENGEYSDIIKKMYRAEIIKF